MYMEKNGEAMGIERKGGVDGGEGWMRSERTKERDGKGKNGGGERGKEGRRNGSGGERGKEGSEG